MKSKNVNLILYIVSSLSVITVVYLCVRFAGMQKMQNILIEAIDEETTKHSVLSANDNNRTHEFTLNGTLLNEEHVVYDADSRQYKLKDIIRGGKLILTFSGTNCRTCIEAQSETLNAYKDSIGSNNVVVLVDYESDILMGRYIDVYDIKFKTFNISPELRDRIPDIGLPYYFVVNDKDMRINKMLVPLKEAPYITEKYFHSVRLNYFDL